jgi:hypothetical protein
MLSALGELHTAEPKRRGNPGYGRLRALRVLVYARLKGLENDTRVVEHLKKNRHAARTLGTKVGVEIGRLISSKQAQAAVWYLQTSRGLLPTNWKNQLTPNLLLQFLKNQKWSIEQLSTKLDDVEELENLENNLKAFIRLEASY